MEAFHYLLIRLCILISLTVIPSFGAINFAQSSDGINPNIPANLLECYNSSFITTQDNLLPMTVNSLIALVRKIEEAVGSMDVRTLSSALLSNFRFDGIQYKPQLDPQGIPYAVGGNEFALWKFLYDKVIAKTTSFLPPNTLTWIERCTLHRMLSMSVDPYNTDNSFDCSKLERIKSYNIRYPRELSKLDDVEMIKPDSGESRIVNEQTMDQEGQYGNFMQDVSGYYPSNCPLEHGVIRNKFGGSLAPGIVLAGIATGTQPQRVPQASFVYNVMQPRSNFNLKRKSHPNGPYYPNSNPDLKPNIIASGRPQGRTPYTNLYENNNNNNNQGGFPQQGNYPTGGRGSGYPNFGGGGGGGVGGAGGVVYPQDLPPPSDIDNKFASTLAGELAFVAIWTGALREGMQIGLDGGWNDTIIPKYYFQKGYVVDALSDARIRGSLDGLLLSSNMEKWVNAARGNLKLSQILNMYYTNKGVYSSEVKSCQRRDFFEGMAPINILKDQTYSTAYVLAGLAPYVLPKLPEYTSYASDSIRSYIPTLSDPACPTDIRNTPKPAPVVDLHLVVDFNWNYRDVSRVIQYIIDNTELWKYGGNFTIINARDASVVIESSHSPLDLGQNFTDYTGSIGGGFDFTKVLSYLKIRFLNKMEFERMQSVGGGIPRVVVFMPYSSSTGGDTEYNIKNRIQYFKETIPDVKFYYLVTGNKNAFSPYTDNSDKDIFIINPGSEITSSLDPFINALITTPRRIIAPACGKNWNTNPWYTDVTINGYLDNNEIHYYRVHPNYFFKNANAKITVTAEADSPVITVCSSRDNPLPIANLTRSGNVYCKQITAGNRHEMYLKSSDCSSVYYAFQCKPFYFSIANQQAPNKAQLRITCLDQECRDPDMTKYTIRHSGLACYSGVSKIAISLPILIISLLINFY